MDFLLFCMDFLRFFRFLREIRPDFRRISPKNLKKYFSFYCVLSPVFKIFTIFSKKFFKKC